jgi:hypothetical protein
VPGACFAVTAPYSRLGIAAATQRVLESLT